MNVIRNSADHLVPPTNVLLLPVYSRVPSGRFIGHWWALSAGLEQQLLNYWTQATSLRCDAVWKSSVSRPDKERSRLDETWWGAYKRSIRHGTSPVTQEPDWISGQGDRLCQAEELRRRSAWATCCDRIFTYCLRCFGNSNRFHAATNDTVCLREMIWGCWCCDQIDYITWYAGCIFLKLQYSRMLKAKFSLEKIMECFFLYQWPVWTNMWFKTATGSANETACCQNCLGGNNLLFHISCYWLAATLSSKKWNVHSKYKKPHLSEGKLYNAWLFKNIILFIYLFAMGILTILIVNGYVKKISFLAQ